MAINLNSSTDCCETSCTSETVNTPGPQGPSGSNGADGTNGTDGVNAYSTTTAAHTVPASSGIINLYVADHAAFSVNQILVISGVGHYLVTHKGTDGGGGEYLGSKRLDYPNDTGTTGATIAAGTEVSPAGPQGPAGTAGAGLALTVKGQLATHDGSNQTPLGVGSDGQAVFANSATATGLGWRSIAISDLPAIDVGTDTSGNLPLTRLGSGGTNGDVAYHNGTSWVKLPAGTDGQTLKISSGIPSWQTVTATVLAAKGKITVPLSGTSTFVNGVNIASVSAAGTSPGPLTLTITYSSTIAANAIVQVSVAIGQAGAPSHILASTTSQVTVSVGDANWNATGSDATVYLTVIE